MKVFNINSHIKVKLTEYGKTILYRTYRRNHDIADEEGYHKFQMWIFIEIFGEYIRIGTENVIEDSNIFIEDVDLKPMSQ
ncbi:hypothetical protein [Priestia aryabhattai]|uniref:hypothetical protein n=1 Tax=Priestia aryabhattai TaxID=412384 RepID=UPI0015F65197|nr:hypothetical protein [Priestia aryabhattai]